MAVAQEPTESATVRITVEIEGQEPDVFEFANVITAGTTGTAPRSATATTDFVAGSFEVHVNYIGDAVVERPGSAWITEEFNRARARTEALPDHARPVVTRPVKRQR
jgi:hypothetical protein